jgi:hypothetical protein
MPSGGLFFKGRKKVDEDSLNTNYKILERLDAIIPEFMVQPVQ